MKVCQYYVPAWARSYHRRAIRKIVKSFSFAKDRGFDSVYLTAIWHGGGADNGFDILEYEVDPLFTDFTGYENFEFPDGRYKDLANSYSTQTLLFVVAKAHELGLRVILDVVPNHVSNKHELARQTLSGHYDCLYIVSKEEAAELTKNGVPSFFGSEPYTLIDGKYVRNTFCDGRQLNLNWESGHVQDYFKLLFDYLKIVGIDGVRVDCGMLLHEDVSKATPDNPLACIQPEKSVKAIRRVALDMPLYFEWFGPFSMDVFNDDPLSWALDCAYVLTGKQSTDWTHPKAVPLFGGHDQMPFYNRSKIEGFNPEEILQKASMAPSGVIFSDLQTELKYMVPDDRLAIETADYRMDADINNPNKRYLARRPILDFLSSVPV